MTIASTRNPATTREVLIGGLVLAGLALALGMRLAVADVAGVQSVAAGVVFGVALVLVSLAVGVRVPRLRWSQLAWGVGGAALLCLPPLLHRLGEAGVVTPDGMLPRWAAVVGLVAVGEELLLRGALFEAVARWRGESLAIAVAAIAFGFLHVPLYGWEVLPLDIAVGVFLGVLRSASGSVTAPALTHLLADLAGWWLR
jgi:membrane protease YdiL (CAAX protease family)